jgi:hypothetical protein
MSETNPHPGAGVDPKAIGQQVRAIVRSLDRMRRSEAYWHVGSVVGEVRRVLEQAWTLLREHQALSWVIEKRSFGTATYLDERWKHRSGSVVASNLVVKILSIAALNYEFTLTAVLVSPP